MIYAHRGPSTAVGLSRLRREGQSSLRMTNPKNSELAQSLAALGWTLRLRSGQAHEAPIPTLVADSGQRGFQNIQAFIHLLVGCDQRDQDANHVGV